MVWAKLDDEILDNEKVTKAGVLGFALHVAAITWCCRKLTDGFVPYARVRLLLDFGEVGIEYLSCTSSPPGVHDSFFDALHNVGDIEVEHIAAKLVSVRLWREDKERGGYWIHDFLDYNPSREEAEALKAARTEAGRRGAEARANRRSDRPLALVQASAEANGQQVLKQTVSKPSAKLCPDPDPDPEPLRSPPVPSVQDPPAGGRTSTKRGSRLPPDWEPSEATQAWARSQGLDPLGPLPEFRDYWVSVPGTRGTKLDWDATYRNRLRQVVARPGPQSSRQPLRDPSSATWLRTSGGDL